jgi:ATP-binding cassette subfamily F protein 3
MIRLAKEMGPNSSEPSREQDLRSYLGSFNFTGDMVKQAVGTMSGGEKARLVLAMIVWQRPNLLLLDEPTNHLDLATREALAMALNEFEGTVMLVSHDRSLLRAVCDEFWMVGRGKVEPFDGDLDDYQRYLLEESKRLREEAKTAAAQPVVPQTASDKTFASESEVAVAFEAPKPAPAPTVAPEAAVFRSPEQRKQDAQRRIELAALTRPLKKSLDQTEQKMAQLQAQKDSLEKTLSTPMPAPEIVKASKELGAVNSDLEALESKWLELSEQIQQIENDRAPA